MSVLNIFQYKQFLCMKKIKKKLMVPKEVSVNIKTEKTFKYGYFPEI